MEKRLVVVFAALVFGWLGGCAHKTGIYHQVGPGENLFRIARAYNYNVQELAEINNIDDADKLKAGQQVFIPGARKQRAVEKAPTAALTSSRRTPARASSSPSTAPSQPESETIKTYHDKFIWPVMGSVTSLYGYRDSDFHDGIDISTASGTPVKAAASGRVIYADDRMRGYGNLIIIKHEGVYSTVYAHNAVNLVKRNAFVTQGQVIARVGNTGRASGPHLHFEVRKGRQATNPLFYLPKRESTAISETTRSVSSR